ncbi:MAG: hypothetical protein CMG41_04145 [Candidatus Marinimicrobia bacterium]|nr:hypothetical protein [Candidatus Neomarinimicrobiota bacterium]
MHIPIDILIDALKIIAGVAVFFVWVVRYDNIKKEFIDYRLPNWLRDLVGILKISFAIMLQFQNIALIIIGSVGIVLLMSGAVVTHIKIKSNFRNILPSITMLVIGLLILVYNI